MKKMLHLKRIVKQTITKCDNDMCGRLTFGSGEGRILEFGMQVAKTVHDKMQKKMEKMKQKYEEEICDINLQHIDDMTRYE